MGHHLTAGPVYQKLQKRLDRSIEGAPPAKELFEILKIMYTEEEADIASRMPVKPVSLEDLSKRLKMPSGRLRAVLDRMADKGVVMDMYLEGKQKSYYMLSPPVIGFFEFSLMRVRSDIPQKQLSELMYGYLWGDNKFAETVFFGDTKMLRAAVHETALKPEQMVEILPYEKATWIVEEAEARAVSLCYCRHKEQHLEHPCKFPMENCMSFNGGATTLARHGLARLIDRAESMDILLQARELGLVQSADNAQQGIGYICNCCGCCCGLMQAVTKKGIEHSIATSNFIAAVDKTACRGCGACVKRCPIKALKIEGKTETEKGYAVVDERICLGCGACVAACKFDSMEMARRAQRVLTPETVLERFLLMAVERGKLQNLLFDNWDDPAHKWARRAMGAVLNLPPAKMLLAGSQMKSRFVRALAAQVPAP